MSDSINAVLAAACAAAFVVVLAVVVASLPSYTREAGDITLSRPDLIRVACQGRMFVRNPDGQTFHIKITGCP